VVKMIAPYHSSHTQPRQNDPKDLNSTVIYEPFPAVSIPRKQC
jgi:hypothetical protein